VTAQASKPKRPAQIASDQPKADDQWGDVCNELFANNEIDDIEEPA